MSAARPPAGQPANLLGALSLLLTDRIEDAITARGEAGNDAIALSALLHVRDDPTVDLLARIVGRSSSGTVRAVDRLEAAGYVRRGATDDGRATVVTLTAAGRRRAREITAARIAVLDDALAVLATDERQQLGELLGRVAAGLVDPQPGATRWICRLCDFDACGRRDDRCPVGAEAMRMVAARGDQAQHAGDQAEVRTKRNTR